ncbi:GNAT family N-acetyltransferase [Citricoccus sp. NR2]|uniref:GNAT family N-acetyltransferase n=1 Tax=Citricoccus sp. NR2 TaxID=3004095 RepID=UPI0022DD33B3|nr:GNAT family N-acetyltransferase [Citricoccus sp. NR2]WBL17858.1 GNAT family N-acetyltransferase [Citricoccus sp. NR2]
MRLSNVAHLRLPFGRLLGYDVRVRRTDVRLPISFDQHRHVSAGDRPGSWMAICFTLPEPVDRERLAEVWLAVIARHGTLRTAFVQDDDGLHLHELDVEPGQWTEHPVGTGQEVNDTVRDVLDRHCTPFSTPSHRLCLLETALRPTVIIGSDHAHVDMWSMLVILRDLLCALDPGQEAAELASVGVPAFVEHTRSLAERPKAPHQVHRRWAETIEASGGSMPRFPLPLGDPVPQAQRVEVRDVLGVDDSAALAQQAHEDGVSTLSEIVSAMTEVTRELVGQPLRAVFPVHSRYDSTWHDSVGWFIANSVLESADPDPRACAAAVREAVQLGSWPLAEVMEPWGGMPEAPGMFAVSWLDLRRLPVRVDSEGLDAQYVGASIRSDGVMLWFILDGSGLHLRCRYPDTDEARLHVGGWLDALVRTVRARADASVSGLLRVGSRRYRVRRARRSEVADVVALLADDELGAARESEDLERYEQVFDALSRDVAHHLTVVRDEHARVVAAMQLTIIPGLTRNGSTRLQIEGLRVARDERSQGLGTALIEWAHRYGKTRGAVLAQVATDRVRSRAHVFYRRLGYEDSHLGFKRVL